MYQLDWFVAQRDENISTTEIIKNKLFDFRNIDTIQFSFWAEHCVECSAPKCFSTCENYEKRSDGRCKRTVYGQKRVKIENSILGFGARMKLKRWGKIETYIYSTRFSVDQYRNRENQYFNFVNTVGKKNLFNPKRVINNFNYWKITRDKKSRSTNFQNSDIFLLELFSYEQGDFVLFVEGADKENKAISRISVHVNPGFNSFTFDYKNLAPEGTNVVRLYPADDKEPEILIINSEFLKYKKCSAEKVKCVVWDLDNTIWNGILSETNDIQKITLKPKIFETIQRLDDRGIVQSISSKNDFEPAYQMLKLLGIDHYFIYPKINWNPKSNNIQLIAKELNLNIDSFAFVDDSIFEREEVKTNLPEVRVYEEDADLLSLPEFDVLVTQDAKNRRIMYKAEEKRKEILNNFSNNYLSFLKDCSISVRLFELSAHNKEKVIRSFELINRTNQLNISGHRYSESEFNAYLLTNKHVCFSCDDKYGSYGVVGYISYELSDESLIINEFALSCRVAKKHIEKAVLLWLAKKEKKTIVIIRYVKTLKNTPIRVSLEEAGFIYNEDVMISDATVFLKDEEIIKIFGTGED